MMKRRRSEPCSFCGKPSGIATGNVRAEWYLCKRCVGTREAAEAGYSYPNSSTKGAQP